MPIHSTENYRSWPHTCRPNRGRGKQKPGWDNPNWQVTEWVMLPRVNRKSSCFPSSGAGIMEYFLSPSFLVSFSVKVTIWGGGGRGNFQIPNPKDLEAFGGEACVRPSCWGGWEETGSQMTQAWHEPSYLGYPDPTSSLLKSKLACSSSKTFLSSSFFPAGLIQGSTVCKYLLRSL